MNVKGLEDCLFRNITAFVEAIRKANARIVRLTRSIPFTLIRDSERDHYSINKTMQESQVVLHGRMWRAFSLVQPIVHRCQHYTETATVRRSRISTG